MSKTSTTKAKGAPIALVILFGMSAGGKARAGTFKGADVPSAVKAAQALELLVLRADKPEVRDLCAKLPAGRIGAKGDNIIPVVRTELYQEVAALANLPLSIGNSSAGKNQSEPAGPKPTNGPQRRRPPDWQDIQAGDLVIAQSKDPLDGWWQMIVVERIGDVFKLRYEDAGRGRPIQKHRLTLGLMYSADSEATAKASKSSLVDTDNPVYPKDWLSITCGQIVLAKEDGPMQQWWEARTVSQEGETFTLQWRDRPELPAINRHRFALGLMQPNPKVR